jgi:hypothetical protein
MMIDGVAVAVVVLAVTRRAQAALSRCSHQHNNKLARAKSVRSIDSVLPISTPWHQSPSFISIPTHFLKGEVDRNVALIMFSELQFILCKLVQLVDKKLFKLSFKLSKLFTYDEKVTIYCYSVCLT